MSAPISKEIPVSNLTTFANVGTYPETYRFENEDDLQIFIRQHNAFTLIGKGSNTLLDPAHHQKPIVLISPNMTAPQVKDTTLVVGAGTSINRLIQLTTQYGLSGLEFASGVPATIGGMVCMNFGCWGHEVADLISRVRCLDSIGQSHWLSSDELGFDYRSSRVLTDRLTVIEVEFLLVKSEAHLVKQSIQTAIEKRLASQPLRAQTFGSTFKNPPGQFAGKIIEDLGYKGRDFGPVRMSEIHANFMVNTGKASFEDAYFLIKNIQQDAKRQYGIQLELEVQLVQ